MEFETRAIHGDNTPNLSKFGETHPPVFQSAAFAYNSAEEIEDVFGGRKFGHIYSRISNPTVTALEQRITALEGGIGTAAVASGMAAISAAIFALTSNGDEIVASSSLFSGTYHFFTDVVEKAGIKVHYVNPSDPNEIETEINDKTRLLFLESIGNPKLDVPDIKAAAAIATKHNIPLVVDTTLTTPLLFKAKEHGVSVTVCSATKYIGPGGTTIGGYIHDCGNFNFKEFPCKDIQALAKKCGEFCFIAHTKTHVVTNVGSLLSPQSAYLFCVGLETLSLRLHRHCDNALQLAEFLESHSKVNKVNYPGLKSSSFHDLAKMQFNGKFGALLTLQLGSKERCFKFINALKVAVNMTNIGDSRTLVIHAASTLYRDLSDDEKIAAGAEADLIRISVGLENIDDIIGDFDQALQQLD